MADLLMSLKGKTWRQLVAADPIRFADDFPEMLFFYSGSADAKPGKGKGKGWAERVYDPKAYAPLAEIKDWRRALSNFHVAPFRYKGQTYRTVEHAFQAAKIALVDPDVARRFALESGDAIGRADGQVAQKNRKIARLNAEQLARWDAMKDRVMEEATVEKMHANTRESAEARRVLKATRNAQLWHLMKQRGKESTPVRFQHLERIRGHLLRDDARMPYHLDLL
jgi:predicted NAD-dependent protein-ADP-ribosyltransferase YbiA (DUF1768 family)